MATFAGLTTTGWLHSYTYSDGLGRELQTKVQAENGKAWVMQNGVPVQIDDITDRFVATGRKIYNNKGNVIKQYEPWFSNGHLYETETQLTQYGVTPIMYYDAPGRLIKTEYPDGTLSRVEFDAWQQKTFDRNDCVNGSQWLVTMQQGTTAQQRAATLAQAHNNTPQVTDLDTMGRPYRITDDAGNGVYCTTVNHIDIAGLTIMVTDAMAVPRDMTRHVYDMTGQLCYTFNIDSGRRWMIVNALDKPLHTWDNLLRKTTIQYDALNRPVATLLYNNNTTALKVESITYGTSATGYTIGKPIIIRDQSGKLDITEYDFKGNMLSSSRRLCTDYSGIINWNTYTDPTGESFVSSFTFDAMNRPVSETTPDGKDRTYEYNKAGLLEKVKIGTTYYVDNINYNEKGQRILIDFGNNTITTYYYDSKNFRLIRLVTTRDNNQSALQDLNYIYDPEGNIVEQSDNAQQTFYFDNSVINPVGKYEYDALYRLVKAEGRELAELAMTNETDCPIKPLNQNNGVLRNYTQLYAYDNLGNLQSVRSVINPWVRTYNYDTATNRLLNTGAGYNYTYDAHGNMISMPHLDTMEWDYKGNLVKTVGGTVTTYYRYDSNGNRVRKFAVKTGGITEERIYSGNYEVYRKKTGGTLTTERKSSFVSDDKKRIAIIDTRTTPSPVEVTIRYQYDNHLGSASLELDNTGAIISYEEYYPFGSSSYRAGRNETETSLKRYRYVGKERDEETGLYYYGARYYAAWLCRFLSVDPLQFKYPHYTPFQYAGNKPISYIDLDGAEEDLPYTQLKTVPVSTFVTSPEIEKLKRYERNLVEYQKTQVIRSRFEKFEYQFFQTSRLLASNISTAGSATQLMLKPLSSNFVLSTKGNFFKKLNDTDLYLPKSKMITENGIYKVNSKLGTGKVIMSSDLSIAYKQINYLNIGLNIISSTLEGIEDYNNNKDVSQAVAIGLFNIGINYNPAVSVLYNFGNSVIKSDQFKNEMQNYYKGRMELYRYSDKQKYEESLRLYQSYSNPKGNDFINCTPTIGPKQ